MSKTVFSQSTMSNLVGMWAIIWTNDEKKSIRCLAFIYGKADEHHFIVQAIDALSGEPNVCKLKTTDQMKDWTFIPTAELVNKIRDFVKERGQNPYEIYF